MDENIVTIIYKEEILNLEIEDVTPENLQEFFALPILPEILFDKDSGKKIESMQWQSHLERDGLYYIYERNNFEEEDSVRKSYPETDEQFNEIVLNSLIASMAVYKVSHENDSEEVLMGYLYEQMTNHYFEYVIPTRHGNNFYLIAKERIVNRFYVAFRGGKDLLNYQYNLKVRRLVQPPGSQNYIQH